MDKKPKAPALITDADDKTVIEMPSEEEPIEIPGYEVIKSLGKGGMGMVYLARQLGVLDREVALKTILPKHEDEVFKQYFLREGQRQAKLHHPNILPIYSAGEAGDMLYLSVSYARNGSLRDRLNARSLTMEQSVNIVAGVLSALNHAHSELDAPMAHLDVKPENILFDGENVFLADFGIAKMIAEEGTAMGVVAGDPRYWPPEQQLDQASTKSDIYALAVMFFEMLSGERPDASLRSITRPEQIKALARQLPPEARVLAPLIGKCLNPNSAARPDAEFLIHELRRLTTPKQSPWRFIAGAAIVLAVGIGLSQTSVQNSIRATWLELFPPPAYPIEFALLPANSKLWVDGREEPLRTLTLTEGQHRVVAVAPGYIGETRLVDAHERVSAVDIQLEPVIAATDEELLRFINSFDGSDQAHDMLWREPTLRTLVELDRLEGSDPDAFDALVVGLRALASARDAIAATSLFYAAFEGIDVADDPKSLMSGLVAASENGYPVASFLRSLYIVQSLLEAEQTFNKNPYAFEEVEALLQRVDREGLPETAALVAGVAGIPVSKATEESRPVR
ncbi:MAG: hypothetical protein Cons2KO_27980 [Congregibacter sp.]